MKEARAHGGAVQQGALCDMALLRKLSVGSPDSSVLLAKCLLSCADMAAPSWVGWAIVHEEISA